jgi:hypothetical protein
MKALNPVARLVLALSLGALLLAGLAPGTPMQTSDPPAATLAATEVEPAADDVSEDDVALIATRRRHVKIKALRWYGIPFFGRFNAITVDVNPTLKGEKSYKVVLKVRHNGTWTRCATKRTKNAQGIPIATIGKAPHEWVAFHNPCKNKAPWKYRVIVPAQHGFLRTVKTVQPLPW